MSWRHWISLLVIFSLLAAVCQATVHDYHARIGFGLRFLKVFPTTNGETDTLVCSTVSEVYLIQLAPQRLDIRQLFRVDLPIFAIEVCDLDADGNKELIFLTNRATLKTQGVSFLGDVKIRMFPTSIVFGSNEDDGKGLADEQSKPTSNFWFVREPLSENPKFSASSSRLSMLHLAVGHFRESNEQAVAISMHAGTISESGSFRPSSVEHIHSISLNPGGELQNLCHAPSPSHQKDWKGIFTAIALYPRQDGLPDNLVVAKHNVRSIISLLDLSDGAAREIWQKDFAYTRTTGIVTGDFDNNGKNDIAALQNTAAPLLGLLPRQGVDLFIARDENRFLEAWHWSGCFSFLTAGCAADLNQDGWLDLLVADASGKLYALLNEGSQPLNFTLAWQWALERPSIRQFRSTDSITSIIAWDGTDGQPRIGVSTVGGHFVYFTPPTSIVPIPEKNWLMPVFALIAFMITCLVMGGVRRTESYLAWSSSLKSLSWALLAPTVVGHTVLGMTLLTMGSFDGLWEIWRFSLGIFFMTCPTLGLLAPFFSHFLKRLRVRKDGFENLSAAKPLVKECAENLRISIPSLVETFSPIPFVFGLSSKKAMVALNYQYLDFASRVSENRKTQLRYWIYLELAHIKHGDVGFANWVRGFVPLSLLVYGCMIVWLLMNQAGIFLPFQAFDFGIATIVWCMVLIFVSRAYLSERENATAQLAARMTNLAHHQQIDPVTACQKAVGTYTYKPSNEKDIKENSRRWFNKIFRWPQHVMHSLHDFQVTISRDWKHLKKWTNWRALPRILPIFLGMLCGSLIDLFLSRRSISKPALNTKQLKLIKSLFREIGLSIAAGFAVMYGIFIISCLHTVHESVLGYWPFGIVSPYVGMFCYRLLTVIIFALIAGQCFLGIYLSILENHSSRGALVISVVVFFIMGAAHASANILTAYLGVNIIVDFPSIGCFYIIAPLLLLPIMWFINRNRYKENRKPGKKGGKCGCA